MNYVFKYLFKGYEDDGTEVEAEAVAMLPADRCTFLFGGRSTWVHFTVTDRDVDKFLVGGDIFCGDAKEALQYSIELRDKLVGNGTISPDPRIPAGPPKKVKFTGRQ